MSKVIKRPEDLGRVRLFTCLMYVTGAMLDELEHANYCLLQGELEKIRMKLCRFLGFDRGRLKQKQGLGLFMEKVTYEYFYELKSGDVLQIFPVVKFDGLRLIIQIKLIRMNSCLRLDHTNTATYTMILTNLTTRKPTRIPERIRTAVVQFNEMMEVLCTPYQA